VEEEAEQLRPQELLACLATRAEISFDCSLSLLTQSWGRLFPLGDKRFFCAFRLQRRSVRNIAAKPFGKRGFIVGINLRIVATTGYGHVG
jgi:hypothetical protein